MLALEKSGPPGIMHQKQIKWLDKEETAFWNTNEKHTIKVNVTMGHQAL